MLPTFVNVLFVSEHNAARSLMAEACLRHTAKGSFKAFSCGVPGSIAGTPDSRAMAALAQAGLATQNLFCKSWAEFNRSGAPRMDFVITLAQDLEPPRWPGQPETAHWSFPDRAAESARSVLVEQRYLRDLHLLRRRIEIFASLPMRGGDRAALRGDVRDLAYLS
jgi:arsenate reductase